jgi:prolyl oligopeptidase
VKNTLLLFFAALAVMTKGQDIAYPIIAKQPVSDTFYTKIIADDYRFMENVTEPHVVQWIEGQNSLTKSVIKKTSTKTNSALAIDKYGFVRSNYPIKQGNYYFKHAFVDRVGAPCLLYQTALNNRTEMLVDPTYISTKDNILLKSWAVSGDSKYLAYIFNRNGSDWGEIKVVALQNARDLPDHITHVKFSNISWRSNGFYYTRYPDHKFSETVGGEVYYHKLGTPQSDDVLVFKRADKPRAFFGTMTTSDERFFILEENDEEAGIKNIFYIDFQSPITSLRPLILKLSSNDNLSILENTGDELIAVTFKDGNNGMVVKINPANPRKWTAIVPENDSALLIHTRVYENQLVCRYQQNGSQTVQFIDFEGDVKHALKFPFGATVGGFAGNKSDKEVLFTMSSYTHPRVVYEINLQNYTQRQPQPTTINYDHNRFETSYIEYPSFDGTLVPLFFVYKKGTNLTSPNPVLMSAYGGFGVVSHPGFSAGLIHFLNSGGVFVYVNIRGGGDKGKQWALQGKGEHKMNSYNDFIAAAEYLISNNYTTPQKLAITGASNGGLVVSVAMTQRPDLFKVVVPVAAPTDMLRFGLFTIGHLHADEYGSINTQSGFENLLSYSPLHNIKENINYPATLLMTGDNDDRVPPFHSYKFAAQLQNRSAQKNPVLLRVEKGAGHAGATANIQRVLFEDADMYDFIMYHIMH